MKTLVIVESPSKTKKISSFLGPDYEVLSSVGHIRDLLNPRDIPTELKEKYGKFSVDVKNGFEPYYDIIDQKKKKVISDLQKALKSVDQVYLATDEDREGEAIAWHIIDTLKPNVEVKRMVFNEITKEAVLNSLKNLRNIDMNLVYAQEARRVLDRLYGYSVSPILWRKVSKGLSAGRVQSPSLRLIVEREIERMEFKTASYFDIEAAFEKFKAKLISVDNKEIATSKDFDENAKLINDKLVLDREATQALLEKLIDKELKVDDIKTRAYRKSPASPFTTSSLQQEALNRLNMSSSQTMRTAQKLYEDGYITYMRTDSNQLSKEALEFSRRLIEEKYGVEYLNEKVRIYPNRSRNAQEAHEAIRPAGDFVDPIELATLLDEDKLKLYTLIYKRTLASQMTDQIGTTTTVEFTGEAATRFRASGTTIEHQGFNQIYSGEGVDPALPNFKFGESLETDGYDIIEHNTKPPARYTDASLVKKLEDLGIGRPSTYASIIQTLLDREYIAKRGKALVPFWSSFSVVKLLKEGFPSLIDYDFTRMMEESLDDIAHGEETYQSYLEEFYFGDKEKNIEGLEKTVSKNIDNIDTIEINSTDFKNGYFVRTGRYGTYIENTNGEIDEKGKYPRVFLKENMTPDELSSENIEEVFNTRKSSSESKPLGKHPERGNLITAQDGRYGPYVTEHYSSKQIHASLLKTQNLEDITLDDAVQLLTIPREIGVDEKFGRVMAHNGPYGPYIKAGSEIRSLKEESELFTIDLKSAVELLSQPKQARGRSKQVVREIGKTSDDKSIAIYKGRYGEYLSDGKTNVTITAKMDKDKITLEEAIVLLEEKAAKGKTVRTKKKTK